MLLALKSAWAIASSNYTAKISSTHQINRSGWTKLSADTCKLGISYPDIFVHPHQYIPDLSMTVHSQMVGGSNRPCFTRHTRHINFPDSGGRMHVSDACVTVCCACLMHDIVIQHENHVLHGTQIGASHLQLSTQSSSLTALIVVPSLSHVHV